MKALGLSLGLLALVLSLRWLSLSHPLDRDEGTYATVAWSALEHGARPYVDVLDHKPPLLYGLYAQAFAWGGPSVRALRWFSLFWQALSAAALGLLLLRWTGTLRVAAIGGACFAFLSSSWGNQAMTANAEGWGWLPLIAGLALLRPWDPERSLWRWSAWGLAAGLAAAIKQPFYLWALAMPLALPGRHGRAAAVGASLAGLAALNLAMAWSYARSGALSPWWFAVFSFHEGYANPHPLEVLDGLVRLLKHLAREQGLLWAIALLGSFGEPGPLRRTGVAALFVGVLASGLSGRWYPHYAQLWTLGLALLVADAFARRLVRREVVVRGALLLAALACYGLAQWPFWAAPDGAQRSLRLMGVPAFVRAPGLAAWVNAHSRPQERLLVWGAEPELYFLAQRLPATKQLNHYALLGITPPWPGAEEDFLSAAEADSTCCIVLMQPLDAARPFQRSLGSILQRRFVLQASPYPDLWVGLRRR